MLFNNASERNGRMNTSTNYKQGITPAIALLLVFCGMKTTLYLGRIVDVISGRDATPFNFSATLISTQECSLNVFAENFYEILERLKHPSFFKSRCQEKVPQVCEMAENMIHFLIKNRAALQLTR
ncbi:hypothetical protein GQX74_009163 [Glossina fuscipes]|nr:hypothetical protein GQX74_009163 [Glossina fuscipes]